MVINGDKSSQTASQVLIVFFKKAQPGGDHNSGALSNVYRKPGCVVYYPGIYRGFCQMCCSLVFFTDFFLKKPMMRKNMTKQQQA